MSFKPQSFNGRIRYVADLIACGARPCRALDSCFENYDGDAVGAALIRQAATNPDLSRSPKIPQQFSEPEVFGCHAGVATCLSWRQHQNPGCGIGAEGTNMPAVVDVGTMEVVMHR